MGYNIAMVDFKAKLKDVPTNPGVYLMLDKDGEIIYVGKAKNLKNRLRSYFFNLANRTAKVMAMLEHVDDFRYIICASEVDALVTENNLIKKHSPRYNILLKDDKAYPFLRIDMKEDFPTIEVVRRLKNDGAKYFGPYTSVSAMKETLDFLIKTFSLRTCNKKLQEGVTVSRPCLYYHIKRCSAPCQGYISREEYLKNFENALAVLSGNASLVINDLKEKMAEASKNLDFEKAAVYRDSLANIQRISQKQKASVNENEDRDVIAMAAADDEAVVQVFFIRSGKMIGREHHYLTGVTNEKEEDVIASFIKQYYADTPNIPKELMLPCEISDADIISEWLSGKRGNKVYLRMPKIGEKGKLIELARKNAALVLMQDAEKIRKEQERTEGAMHELAECLGIPDITRVESYDISNTNGFESVGSMVVFENGKPKKHDYRKFKIRTVKGPDDYASMKEMLTRRLEHGIRDMDKNSGFAIFPDVILMDGGKGQVNIALSVLKNLGLDIPVCGMVKDDRHRTRGLYYNGEEIQIQVSSECFKLITRIQDETHRFAIEYHRSLRSKEQVRSVLDDIKGIGPKRRKALMRYFKSLERIREASVEELEKVEGMNISSAKQVYEFFRAKGENNDT